MRSEVKARGLPDTNDNCWRVFIQRVRGWAGCGKAAWLGWWRGPDAAAAPSTTCCPFVPDLGSGAVSSVSVWLPACPLFRSRHPDTCPSCRSSRTCTSASPAPPWVTPSASAPSASWPQSTPPPSTGSTPGERGPTTRLAALQESDRHLGLLPALLGHLHTGNYRRFAMCAGPRPRCCLWPARTWRTLRWRARMCARRWWSSCPPPLRRWAPWPSSTCGRSAGGGPGAVTP